MAEELSKAISYTKDDFYCPVCQEVLKMPVQTSACQLVSCRKCFLTATRGSGIHCPLCCGNVTRRERACPERALELENIMCTFSGSCRSCAKHMQFYHTRHCYKYSISAIIPNFQIFQDSVGKKNTSSSGHPTCKCHLGQESRQHLLGHCNSNHLFPMVPVNLQLDEETQYQTAVEDSFQVNI
ncbi:E3 ubiquitin-protein ligase RNF138-like [Fukomys damarensis]|uniref:E3 ubiquitin-protein ligase RNF138-like n=1 Tax=Fukomys damarensis TaxID=885580 RepID=UPI0008FEB11C|nr:E3 ubiquitin-protein ligase RNF138-like [Fukomys damarensis]